MKTSYFLVGILIGCGLGFTFTKWKLQADKESANPGSSIENTSGKAPLLSWPDSLEAVTAAPRSHQVVYEDSTVRILQVVLEANQTESVHVHKWKSIMWFAQATPMIYYMYGLKNGVYTVTDSITIPQMPQSVLNHGEAMEAEDAHAIRNAGDKVGIAYRVEFKKKL